MLFGIGERAPDRPGEQGLTRRAALLGNGVELGEEGA